MRDPTGLTEYFRFGGETALQTIVAPAANTKGVMLHGLTGIGKGEKMIRVMMKKTTPTAIGDVAQCFTVASIAGPFIREVNGLPTMIPAGWGLFEFPDSTAANSGLIVQYELRT